MITLINPIRFNFIHRNSIKGVEIIFKTNQLFWSCSQGTDLTDFDTLLEHFVPNIDLCKIKYMTARWWEQLLYRSLIKCHQQRTATNTFIAFCERISKIYGRKENK